MKERVPHRKNRPTSRVPKYAGAAAWLSLMTLSPDIALAHHVADDAIPTNPAEGFLSGLAHPIIGIDHLVVVIAVGLLSAVLIRGALGPATFIGGTVAGCLAHVGGVPLPGGEVAIAVSAILLGLVLLGRHKLEPSLWGTGFAIAGLLHGHAYGGAIVGAEMASLGSYLLGFAAVQLAIAQLALALQRQLLARRPAMSGWITRTAGAGTLLVGLVLATQHVVG